MRRATGWSGLAVPLEVEDRDSVCERLCDQESSTGMPALKTTIAKTPIGRAIRHNRVAEVQDILAVERWSVNHWAAVGRQTRRIPSLAGRYSAFASQPIASGDLARCPYYRWIVR